MQLRRLGTTIGIVIVMALAIGAQSAGASNPNLLGDGGFETPKIPADNFARFIKGDTLGTCALAMPGTIGYQSGCWRVFGGDVDVMSQPYWDAKSGTQSIELNGSGPGQILQEHPVAPNTKYRFSFALAGDPNIAGVVSVLAVQETFDAGGNYISGSAIGTYSFDTTGHTATSMGYKQINGTFTTGPNAAYADVELQSTTDNTTFPWWGPVVDGAGLTQL